MPVPMVSSAKGVTFGGFTYGVASVRVAGVAPRDIQTCFVTRGESRFVWQARYFCDVFRRCVAVFVAGAALWTCPSSFCVAGAALQTCRVACFSNRMVRAASSGDKVQIPWQAWHFVRCAET